MEKQSKGIQEKHDIIISSSDLEVTELQDLKQGGNISINSSDSDFIKYPDEYVTAFLVALGYSESLIKNVPEEVEYIIQKVSILTTEEADVILKQAVIDYQNDENLSSDLYTDWERLCNVDPSTQRDLDSFLRLAYASTLKYSSPYQEVRSVVEVTDDPSIPVETFRSYFLAIVWSIIGSGFNEFFAHRIVTISVSTPVIQMFLHSCGTLWARFVPCWGVTIRGRKYAINIDTPWTKKEQMFSTLLFAICMGTFYTHYNILTQRSLYHDNVGFGYQVLLSLSVQFIGFGFAGILRRFVVFPSRAVWPTVMPTIALNKALCEKDAESGMSRYKVFYITFSLMFLYNWFPTYLINIFNTFNWMTWIAPTNVNLANVTGGVTGLGFNPFPTFDWNVVSNLAPLVIPFWSTLTTYLGALLSALIVLAVYYSNYSDTQYLPMFTQPLFTNTGKRFNVQNILNDKYELDQTKYQAYSPPFYTAGNLVNYGCFIACYPLLMAYSLIVYSNLLGDSMKSWIFSIVSLTKKKTWKDMMNNESSILDDFDDPHSNMMKNYKEVPEWWYATLLILALVCGIIVVEVYHTNTPVWGLFMSLGFNFIFLIPITQLQAVAGVSIGLNLLIEIIVGYALPGNPFALMIIKAFGYNIDGQADNYVSNLKMAHYCKIPPMALFRGQCIMVLLQIFVNLGVLNWQISNIKDFCTPHQSAKFTCPESITYFNASIVWGVIGPKRIFNEIYPILKWCWLIGALLGVLFGLWRKYNKFYPKNFNPIVFVYGMISLSPPYGLMYFTPGLVVSYISQYYLKRHNLSLWERYNYIVSSGLNTGLILSAIIIFFAVQYKEKTLSWWGNNVPYTGVDGIGVAMKNITTSPKGYFGPAPGHYP